MKRTFLCALLLATFSCQSGKHEFPEEIQKGYDQATQVTDNCTDLLSNYQRERNFGDFMSLYNQLPDMHFDYSVTDLSAEQYDKCRKKKNSLDSLKHVIHKLLIRDLHYFPATIAEVRDQLIEAPLTTPFYAKRGENITLEASSEKNFTLKIFNADSRELIYNSQLTHQVSHELYIPNSAVYLAEIKGNGPLYIDCRLSKQVTEVKDLQQPAAIAIDTVSCNRNEFRAQQVKGIKIRKIFEEPRKITLRSQGKALFSGSSRSIVALNLPANSTDVMYSLRISTSDSDRKSDGEFFDKTSKRYHEIRFLGLPIYESSRSNNSLLRELLSASEPFREEEAYCDLYVFKTAAEARKFQNNSAINTLKYNLDYSMVGTQSCNGRIPVQGLRTLYLGFENPKVTSSVYLWLEALGTVQSTEYFKEVYVKK